MLFVNKLKVLTLMTCLVLVGQGFAQESSQYSAPGSSQYSAPESSSSSKMDFWSNYTSVPGSESINDTTYYHISTAEELAWFAARMNETTKSNPNVNTSESAILLADIDLSGKLWVPIAAGKGDGIFMGTFDGNGHKITGLTIDGHRIAYETTNVYCRDKENKPLCNGQNIGFFGSLKGTVKNLSLEVADIQASNSEGLTMQMGKPISVGTLVGWMSAGTIDGVYVSGRINTSGNGQGVGGIVGNAASGTVENSVSDVSIYASGDKVFIGGILGYTKGEVNVHSCMYTGESIINDGKNGSIGGIVGNSTSNKLNATNSFFDTDVAGNKGVGTGSVTNENKPTGVKELNTEQVACGMNGKTWDANLQVCSGEGSDEWEVGISELSQNGSDGYKITFVVNAEGAAFPDEAVTTKLVAKNAPITADGISLPTREGYKFAGWAETDDAEDPSADLGTATGRRTIYAVWYEKFTVTFNAGSGHFSNNDPVSLIVAKGDLISLDIEVPEKASIGEDHFYFAGWTTGTTSEVIFDKNQDVTGLVDFDVFTVSAATVFYPAWTKEIVHTVKFNANGHGQTKLEQVDISDGLVLNAPDNPSPYKGYQYDAWCITQDCQNSSDVFTFPQTINSSFELFAKWSAVPYTINYNLDGGSVPNPGNPSTYTIEDQFVLKDPSKTCYDFIGWYDLNGNHVEGITKGTTEEKTFSARWTQQTKAINYSTGNIIQATATSQEFLCGESITLSDTISAFSRPGYTQDGWTTTIGGNNVMAPKASYTGTETVTLYAHWSLNSYDIIYNLYGGEFATSAISSYTTEDAVVLAEPTRSGYEFQGWYDNTQFEGVAVTEIPLESTGDKNFYAKWSDPIEYTATYDLAGGSMEGDESFTFTVESDNIDLATPTRDGYTFVGWLDGVTSDVETVLPAGSFGNRTLTAQWTPIEFSATYDLAGGSMEGDESFTFTVESNDISLATPTKNGYSFVGWLDGVTSNVVTVLPTNSIGDRTLTAQWSLEEYTATYELAGGSMEGDESFTFTIVSGNIDLATPTRDGYTFAGWLDGVTGDVVTVLPTGSFGNRTLTAQWTPIEYTITYKIDNESAELTPNGFTVVDNVTLAVPEMDGYTFDGWYLNDGMTGEKVTGFGAGTYAANQTFYGKWIRTYRITYVDADGLENNNPTSYTVLENDLELQPVSKTGFKFLGWFNEEDALVESIAAGTTGDINLTAKWAKFPILITQSGGVKILQNEDKTVVAEIDGNSTETVSFTEDVSVDRVTFDRTFSESVNSTIMLPFTVSVDEVEGGTFYEFADLTKEEDGMYHFHVKEPSASTLEANKPYIFIPSAKSITFNLNAPVAINTSVDNPTSSGNWHFIGTYQTRTFTSADPEFGFAYGFAGEEKNGLTLGKFHKVKENARLKPMRGYLLYDESRATTKSANAKISERLSIFDLPEDIDVEILSNSGVIIGGGTYNTRTGVFKMDRWYDLQGRKLNGKPTVQGTYYHNGKRVIVK